MTFGQNCTGLVHILAVPVEVGPTVANFWPGLVDGDRTRPPISGPNLAWLSISGPNLARARSNSGDVGRNCTGPLWQTLGQLRGGIDRGERCVERPQMSVLLLSRHGPPCMTHSYRHEKTAPGPWSRTPCRQPGRSAASFSACEVCGPPVSAAGLVQSHWVMHSHFVPCLGSRMYPSKRPADGSRNVAYGEGLLTRPPASPPMLPVFQGCMRRQFMPLGGNRHV